MFERKTLEPLPWHEALTNVVAMCQRDNVIYHLCLLEGRCAPTPHEIKRIFAELQLNEPKSANYN